MALQTTGQISLKNIADEFGDTAPHSMSEFYGAASGIPTSGAIKISNFYGASSAFTFTKTISSNIQNYNLRNDMIANGWDGVTPANVTVTINSGVYVWSNSTSTAGFTTGTMSSGTTISIINNGYIIGKGGNGAGNPPANPDPGFSAGAIGGPAINLNYPVSITNNSYIAGGGGGGASGRYSSRAGYGGGGAGGGTGGGGASGGSIGAAGSNSSGVSGGGGGRILPGSGGGKNAGGGAGGGGGGSGGPLIQVGPRTYYNSAAGGGGGGWGASGGGAAYGVQLFGFTINPGAGGSANSAGSTGTVMGSEVNQTGLFGGSGGKAVNLNGNTVTWVATGTRYGAIS